MTETQIIDPTECTPLMGMRELTMDELDQVAAGGDVDVGKVVGGAIVGAATGAAVGSVLPAAGTVAGAVIGAASGAAAVILSELFG